MREDILSVLIIDNDLERSRVLTGLVKKTGLPVLFVQSPAEFPLGQMEIPSPIVLIAQGCKDEMPEHEFFEITSLPGHQDCFVVYLVNGYGGDEENRAYDAGADGVLTWPMEEEIFLTRFRAFIHQKKKFDRFNSEARLMRQLLDTGSEGILVVEEDGKILFANMACTRFFSKPPTELIGTRYGYPLGPGSSGQVEFLVGSQVLIADVRMSPTTIGAKRAWVLNLEDVSDTIGIQEEQKLQIEQLSQRNLQKDKMLSLIAHDLKNPFNGLLNFSEVLVRDFDHLSREEVIRNLKHVNSLAGKIFSLMLNLLDWAKFQGGFFKCQPKPIHIHSLVKQVFVIFEEASREKDLHLVNLVPTDLSFDADENILQAVLRNLLSNSVKFSSPGGSIVVVAMVGDSTITLEVRDSGVGIKAEKLKAIFSHEPISLEMQSGNGTGIGLRLCHDLVNLMGGRLDIWSEPGSGTTVRCILEKCKAPASN